MRILKLNDRGAEVKQLQQLLNWWGIPTKIDGHFGLQTKDSVIQFQMRRTNGVTFASQNLVIDGIVGRETWAELTKTPVKRLNNLATSIHPQMSAFLKMIRVPEGTSSPDGYMTMFTGKLFSSFDDHPRILQPTFRSIFLNKIISVKPLLGKDFKNTRNENNNHVNKK